MKKSLLWIIFLAAVAGIAAIYFRKPQASIQKQNQCQINKLIFYYSDTCKWCNQVKDENTLDKLKDMGVDITKINISVGPVRHKFEAVPTFVIGNQVLTGYRTLAELENLLGCQGSP